MCHNLNSNVECIDKKIIKNIINSSLVCTNEIK